MMALPFMYSIIVKKMTRGLWGLKVLEATLFNTSRKINREISGSLPLAVSPGLKNIAGNFITISITTISRAE
jgi:hypothetical protein